MKASKLFAVLFTVFLCNRLDAKSICHGNSAKGRIEDAVALPSSGNNFEAYSTLGVILRRNYVHESVQKAVIQSYEILSKEGNKQHFVYGETGWPEGGRFRPHKSHQAGLSVDFMVPLLNANREPTPFPHNVFNKWGYNLEFDSKGQFENVQIDFESIAQHLLALKKSAEGAGIGIRYVIFEPSYQTLLRDTPSGSQLAGNVTLYDKPVWIRHDEHYHVEFQVPCEL